MASSLISYAYSPKALSIRAMPSVHSLDAKASSPSYSQHHPKTLVNLHSFTEKAHMFKRTELPAIASYYYRDR
jgi:hypothetical protein